MSGVPGLPYTTHSFRWLFPFIQKWCIPPTQPIRLFRYSTTVMSVSDMQQLSFDYSRIPTHPDEKPGSFKNRLPSRRACRRWFRTLLNWFLSRVTTGQSIFVFDFKNTFYKLALLLRKQTCSQIVQWQTRLINTLSLVQVLRFTKR